MAQVTPLLERFRYVLAVLMTVIVGAGIAVFLLRQPPPTTIVIIPPGPTGTALPTLTPTPTASPQPIQIYVTGAVNQPETTVVIPYHGRVSDAIAAVGGLAEDADTTRINMAQILYDGDQVHVFALVDSANTQPGTGESAVVLATPGDHGIVYINSASSEALQTLPRIGPAMAENIIAHREAYGPFHTLEDLDAVNGIGPATIEQLAPLISFENH